MNKQARSMRRAPSVGEAMAWKHLRAFRAEGFAFRRQHALGEYVVDFVCLRRRLVVEIDGGLHDKFGNPARDLRRDAWLNGEGYAVLRIRDRDLRGEAWIDRVRAALNARPVRGYRLKSDLPPSPRGGGAEVEQIDPGDRFAERRGRGEASAASIAKEAPAGLAKQRGRAAARTPTPAPPPSRGRGDEGCASSQDERFWKTKSLTEMSEAEWESLCDGCGKCCLIGLEDADTGEIYLTDTACKLFDGAACACGDYANRFAKVPDCTKLTPENVPTLHWLPKTCAYRLVAERRDLYWWHPLISGDRESVHAANVSVRGKTRPERGGERARTLMKRITDWPKPKRKPRGA